ncbi:histidine kinase [uncultured Psychroserpens sp.]|uniref:sensor histidine kinase n=1 Tax=uncultured Psychroserpens sp. TaxID=255436 RepID=UPI0026169D2E|nr:histidine kinase [uncultured Psychroserpens sp.]
MQIIRITKLLTFALVLFTSVSKGQEQTTKGLVAYFETYDTLKTNEEKYNYTLELTNKVKNLTQNSIDTLMPKSHNSFIARLVIAEYWRVKKKHELAKELFVNLEADVLNKRPVDFTLLASIRWNRSHNFSLNNFSYEKGLEDLNKGLEYAEKSRVIKQIIPFHSNLSFYNNMLANYEQSLYHNKERYELAKEIKDTIRIILSLQTIMMDLNTTRNNENAIKVWGQIRPILKKFPNYSGVPILYSVATDAYTRLHQLDSAKYYNNLCFKIDSASNNYYNLSKNKFYKAKILLQSNEIAEAKTMLLSSYKFANEYHNKTIESLTAIELAQLYLKEKRSVEAISLLSSVYAKTNNLRSLYKGNIELWLSKAYEANKVLDSALFYRNKSDASLELENRNMAKKQAALAKIELDIDTYIQENQALNKKVSKTTITKNILIYSFLSIALLTGFFLYQRNQKEKLRISQYQEQISHKERIAIEAELNSIRSQMNPHFMFNSLNSINEFIQNDSSDDASNYLVKFSRLMRSTLNYSKRKFVTLKEEIDLLKLYLELESLRFYNSIDYTFNVDRSINLDELYIPPMMLQPFVENAIWHGLMAKDDNRKMKLRFYEKKDILVCEIEDNGVGRAASAKQNAQKVKHKSQGMGLTERRLELLKSIHGKEARVEVLDLIENGSASGTMVKVILPKQNNP